LPHLFSVAVPVLINAIQSAPEHSLRLLLRIEPIRYIDSPNFSLLCESPYEFLNTTDLTLKGLVIDLLYAIPGKFTVGILHVINFGKHVVVNFPLGNGTVSVDVLVLYQRIRKLQKSKPVLG
jgi:hypothetical protein